MSDHTDNRRRIGKFLGKLFERNRCCKSLFYGLCRKGCSPIDLAGLLWVTSVFAVGNSEGRLDTGDPSDKEVKDLAEELQKLANIVARVNQSSLNPKIWLRALQPDDNPDTPIKNVGRLYDHMPKLMKGYAIHLDRLRSFRKKVFKRLDIVHSTTLRLLLYMQESTGNPRYEDITNLLTEGFFAEGGDEAKLPTFFTADALAKLKQRTTHFGFNSRSSF